MLIAPLFPLFSPLKCKRTFRWTETISNAFQISRVWWFEKKLLIWNRKDAADRAGLGGTPESWVGSEAYSLGAFALLLYAQNSSRNPQNNFFCCQRLPFELFRNHRPSLSIQSACSEGLLVFWIVASELMGSTRNLNIKILWKYTLWIWVALARHPSCWRHQSEFSRKVEALALRVPSSATSLYILPKNRPVYLSMIEHCSCAIPSGYRAVLLWLLVGYHSTNCNKCINAIALPLSSGCGSILRHPLSVLMSVMSELALEALFMNGGWFWTLKHS